MTQHVNSLAWEKVWEKVHLGLLLTPPLLTLGIVPAFVYGLGHHPQKSICVSFQSASELATDGQSACPSRFQRPRTSLPAHNS
jgi:hypothetical protein